MKNKDIYIVIPFFHLGGVERWAVNYQRALVEIGYRCEIIVLGTNSINLNYYYKDSLIYKGHYKDVIRILRNKNSVVISALTKLNLFVSLVGLLLPGCVITSVHLSIKKKKHESKLKYFTRVLLHVLICRLSKYVIVVSKGVENEIKNLVRRSDKIKLIYNPCYSKDQISVSRIQPKKSYKYVSAGRLHDQKRFDILIRSFIDACDITNNYDLELHIYGEGQEREPLQEIINTRPDINIKLEKPVSNIFTKMKDYDIFILSSEYEGFGNILAEALAAGCYCISFDINHGPREILDNGKYGKLVPFGTNYLIHEIINIDHEMKFNKEELESHLYKFTIESTKENLQSLLM